MNLMKSISNYIQLLRPGLYLALILCPSALWSAPSIQSIDLSPNSLVFGQSFTVSVTASQDVTQGIATLDFRPVAPRLLRITLAKQGTVWTGTIIIPADLQVPSGAAATVRVLLFDGNRKQAEKVVTANLTVGPISAVFENGVLTITGDDQDNTLLVSPNSTGALQINGGTLPITGGVP